MTSSEVPPSPLSSLDPGMLLTCVFFCQSALAIFTRYVKV
jgi:hypothetical protein